MQEKNTERLKAQDFNIFPNILHVDADTGTDAGGIATALLHLIAGKLITCPITNATVTAFSKSFSAIKGQKCQNINTSLSINKIWLI